MSVLEALEKLLEEQLAAEGITPAVLDYVALEIEYSPVIPFVGGGLEDAVSVYPWGFPPSGTLPEKFEVQHPLITRPVNRETLKIMRARYLLARDAHYRPIVKNLFQRLRQGTLDADRCRNATPPDSPAADNER